MDATAAAVGATHASPLRKACEDFEAFLLSYIIRQMWQAAEAIASEEHPFMSQAYRDMFTVEFAQSLTPSMNWGIAETLYRELSRLLLTEKVTSGG